MMHALNARLGESAGGTVSIVDCERLSAQYGKRRWFDDRYWYVSRQAVALDALPTLARHTAAVLAADLGLSGKCLVLDLDNTLWGGVIGEDGLSGIRLGAGPEGEAFAAFQRYILQLKEKGIILAVCSKNNEADAREPFEKHPDMALKLEDIAMFIANWKPKSQNIADIASTLNLGLDALVFVEPRQVRAEQEPDPSASASSGGDHASARPDGVRSRLGRVAAVRVRLVHRGRCAEDRPIPGAGGDR